MSCRPGWPHHFRIFFPNFSYFSWLLKDHFWLLRAYFSNETSDSPNTLHMRANFATDIYKTYIRLDTTFNSFYWCKDNVNKSQRLRVFRLFRNISIIIRSICKFVSPDFSWLFKLLLVFPDHNVFQFFWIFQTIFPHYSDHVIFPNYQNHSHFNKFLSV